jgi:hypothetical protein
MAGIYTSVVLPNPADCDANAFADCLVSSGQGYDLMNDYGNKPM